MANLQQGVELAGQPHIPVVALCALGVDGCNRPERVRW